MAGIEHIMDWAHVGSSYALGEGNDIDIVIYTAMRETTEFTMRSTGWVVTQDGFEGSGGDAGEFTAFRKDEFNAMVTNDLKFFESFVVAAEATKALKLTNRIDRVILHRVLMHQESAEEAQDYAKLHAK